MTPGRLIGIVEDTGELLPNGEVVTPHRPTDASAVDAVAQGSRHKGTPHAFIGGMARRGKTNAAAVAAALADSSTNPRPA